MLQHGMFALTIGMTFWLAVACGTNSTEESASTSEIEPDEHLVFFRTSGWFDESRQRWHLPIHGWIYEPQRSHVRKAVFARLLKEKYGLAVSAATEENFSQRVDLLVADNERGKRIVIRVGDKEYELPASAENGHFDTVLEIAPSDLSAVEDGLLVFSAVTAPGEQRVFQGRVRLLAPVGRSIISDIDDTVKLSHVTERTRLLQQTFFDDFEPVEGMPELYRTWHERGGSVHFVSSSPWQLYHPLVAFLTGSEFPWATLSLKKVRFRDSSVQNLFKPGTETKPAAIDAILDAYPKRTFILIGDSGEQDAEVYADIARRYPDQIDTIYIRWVSDDPVDSSRFEATFTGLDPGKWKLFTSPTEIAF
ncbi:MAG: DUF2183 domain-containing protein [bacterium]|nr:DUF2183 domain-containing protein [bacterium]